MGKSYNEIASELGLSRSTAIRIVGKYMQTGNVTKKKNIGRPRTFTDREERLIVRNLLKSNEQSASEIAKRLSEEQKKEISAECVSRVMKRHGFFARKKIRKPFLTRRQRIQRLNFAKQYSKKDKSFWKRVIFSDECTFQVFRDIRGQWTWRRSNEKLLPRNLSHTRKHGGGTLHIWSCFTYYGIGWMCLLPEGLDAPTLITIFEDELKKTLNHYYPRARLIHLQQDNSSVHTSKIVKNWLKKNKIPVLPWPSQSPDLNPIENLWADLKKRVYRKNHNITSKKVLWNVIQEEWEATPLETCKRLIESIPERLKAVLKVKGNPTRY